MKSEAEQRSCLESYAQSKDERILEPLVALHLDAAYGMAYSYFGNEHDAADAVQDALINVMKSAASFRGRSKVRSWVLSIVINACHQKRRAEMRLKNRESKFMKEQLPMSATEFTEPESNQQEHQALYNALQELPEHYRMPLILHYIDGNDLDEVANVMNRPRATIRKQLSRGIEKIKEILPRHGFEMGVIATPVVLLQHVQLPSAPANLVSAIPQSLAKAATAVSVTGGSVLSGVLQLSLATKVATTVVALLTATVLTWMVVSGEQSTPLTTAELIKQHSQLKEPRWTPAVQIIGENPFANRMKPTQVCVSDDNSVIAAGTWADQSGTSYISLWNRADQSLLQEIPIKGSIVTMSFSEDGDRLYYVLRDGEEGALCAYDLAESRLVYSHPHKPSFIVPSKIHKRKHLAVVAANQIPWGSPGYFDNDAEGKSKKTLLEQGMNRFDIFDALWSGSLYNLDNGEHAYFDFRGLIVYDLKTGEPILDLKQVVRPENEKFLYGLEGLDIDFDGKLLACIDRVAMIRPKSPRNNNTKRLTIWEIESGSLVYEKTFEKNVSGDVQFLPNGNRVLLGGAVYDYKKEEMLHDVTNARLKVSGDGTRVLAIRDDRIVVYDTKDMSVIKEIESSKYEGQKYGNAYQLSYDGHFLTVLNSKKSFSVIDVNIGRQAAPVMGTLKDHPEPMYMPDGRLLVINGQILGAGQDVQIYNDAGVLEHEGTLMVQGWQKAGLENWSKDGRYFLSECFRFEGFVHYDLKRMKEVNKHQKFGESYKSYLSPNNEYALAFGFFRNEGERIRHPSFTLFNNTLEDLYPQVKINLERRQNAIPIVYWDEDRGRILIGSHPQGDDKRIQVVKKQFKSVPKKDGEIQLNMKKSNQVEMDFVVNNESGAFDIVSGKKASSFSTQTGAVQTEVQFLAHHKHWIYGRPITQGEALGCALWETNELKFVRALPDVGERPVFSEDGLLLLGAKGVVDLSTGTWLKQFDEFDWHSPSHRLAANYQITDNKTYLDIHDIRTDVLLWRVQLADSIIPKQDLSLIWHPGESAVLMTVKNKSLLIRVSLFKSMGAATDITLEAALTQLSDKDVEKRMQAVSKLRKAGDTALQLIKQKEVIELGLDHIQKRMLVLTLRLMAIDGLAQAEQYLAEMTDQMGTNALRALRHYRLIRARHLAPIK